MGNIVNKIEGEEVTDVRELAKIKSVEELMPKPIKENNIQRWGNYQITEEHYKVIEECLRQDCTVAEACMTAWISTQAYYQHTTKNPDFARRVALARQFPKMMARAAIMKRIKMWDSKTALRFLELRDKRRYNTDPSVIDEEEEGIERRESKVQFISVASNEWQNSTTNNDIQTFTKPSSVSEWYAISWESGSEKQTPRENEEEALKRLDSLNFSNG